jgi:hypothetical protein
VTVNPTWRVRRNLFHSANRNALFPVFDAVCSCGWQAPAHADRTAVYQRAETHAAQTGHVEQERV